MKFLNQPIYKNMIMCYNILGYKYSILFKQLFYTNVLKHI